MGTLQDLADRGLVAPDWAAALAPVEDRIDAVLAARAALEQNVKPQIAIEALTVALRLPA